jgi:hypothetical protein
MNFKLTRYAVMQSDQQIKVVLPSAPESERTISDEWFAGCLIYAASPESAAEQFANCDMASLPAGVDTIDVIVVE